MSESYRTIPLRHGLVAVVDADDYPKIAHLNWYASSKIPRRAYVRARGGYTLHRFIMDAKPGEFVDHIDGDPLNNRRSNLRICSDAQNTQNRHKRRRDIPYLGVSLPAGRSKWNAHIMSNRCYYWLGTYDDMETAARVRDAAAVLLHGEFASLNFPDTPIDEQYLDIARKRIDDATTHPTEASSPASEEGA